MWIVSDNAMRELLGGEFCQVVEMKQLVKDLSIKEMWAMQFKYFSYDGFRKFYNKYLSKIIDDIRVVDDDKFIVKVFKFALGIK